MNRSPLLAISALTLALMLAAVATTFARNIRSGQNETKTKTEVSVELTEASALSQQVVKLYAKGKFKDALSLAKRALDLREKALGKDHILVGRAQNNLASIFFALGEYADAQSRYEQTLQIYEKTFGSRSPDLCEVLEGLAWTDYARSDNKTAETLFQRALSINQSSSGVESLQAAKSAAAIASFYQKTKQYEKSVNAYKYAIDVYKRVGASSDSSQLIKLTGDCMCALAAAGLQNELNQLSMARSELVQPTGSATRGVPRTGGVLQGTAIKRVEPSYPVGAKREHVTGTVLVQVEIDEEGVVEAQKVYAAPRCWPPRRRRRLDSGASALLRRMEYRLW